ncbi:WD40 repeat domain-containing protein, partial [Salmonella sp. SAL4450]|uniref:WD40 repeat domain-containing protein n=1 Tax=Salmonella sp. SAL4450 TaxID=3159905 RepID=UPI00397BF617
MATGQHLRTLYGHSRSVRAIRFSADGRTIATGGSDGFLRLWRTDNGHPLGVLGAGEGITDIRFGNKGDVLLAVSMDGVL